ncbi:MAG: hypothetical protein R2880_08575 [Deinococcales bacterium]
MSLYRVIGLLMLLGVFTHVWAQAGQTGAEISLTPGFQPDPLSFEYISGGPVDANANYGGDCKGFIASEPDHVVTLEQDFPYLRITVKSGKDTTMILESSDGSVIICKDDISRENFNPQIGQALDSGVYKIYIGSYDAGNLANYSISFSESSP